MSERVFTTSRILILLTLILATPAMATDPPDSEVNPLTGNIETGDTSLIGAVHNIRYTIDPGGGQPILTVLLTNNGEDDISPRIEISTAGDTWITWWRDGTTPQVFIIKKTYTTGIWSTEVSISETAEDSSQPELVHDGTNLWIAYEIDNTGDRSIAVSIIGDEPEPVGSRIVLGTTGFSNDLDVLPHAVSGHLWVTWVDSTSDVGWSEYDYSTDTWTVVSYESYSIDSIEDARNRIGALVTGTGN